jgi:hypothetical protein
MKGAVTAGGEKSIDEIIEKIISQDDLKDKLSVYQLFYITYGMRNQNMFPINAMLQINHPELWKEINKIYYPSFIDKIKSKIKSIFKL